MEVHVLAGHSPAFSDTPDPAFDARSPRAGLRGTLRLNRRGTAKGWT